MITVNDLSSSVVTVLGIGISNIPLINYLLEKNCKIVARDKKSREKLGETANELENKGVKLILGDNYLDDICEKYIFRSPGIRYDKPQILTAIEKGSILTSEIELFLDLCPCKTIGITGSDGKTTTTTIISEILKKDGKSVYTGGNIGNPPISFLDKLKKDDIVVLELSSFQLHTLKKSPEISVITNISPNHLDYHKDMCEYVSAKENIYIHNGNKKVILNYKNSYTEAMVKKVSKDTKILFFNSIPNSGVYEDNGYIFYNGEKILQTGDIKIVGHHNIENYMAAIAAVYPDCSKDAIQEVAKSFNGVEHRIEFVRELNGVSYYNSSIDSSPTRTANALACFTNKVIVICGGYDKNIPFEPLAKTLSEHAKTVILTGATANKINNVLHSYEGDKPEIFIEKDFKSAVLLSSKTAKQGDTVILSPACASFDAFPNFEVRGKTFKDIINSL